jgi:hypothetical protein
MELSELRVDDRVRCTGPLNDGSLGINHTLIGVEGTVSWVGQFTNRVTSMVSVDWDNGSGLNLLAGDPFEKLEPRWEIDYPVVAACLECGAVGDVECEPTCENKDFRDAEFDGVIEPEPE